MASQHLSRPVVRAAQERGYEVVGVALVKRVGNRRYFIKRLSHGWYGGLTSSVMTRYPNHEAALNGVDAMIEEEH